MINIRPIKLAEVRGAIEPLLYQHWEEIANYKDTVPLEPDWPWYENLEKEGNFFALIVETIDSRTDIAQIIGYSAFFLNVHPHYKSLTVAQNDVLYLRPDYRKAGIGLKLIKESERMLKEKGIHKIQWHVKLKHDFTPLLEKLGYMKEDIILGKMV